MKNLVACLLAKVALKIMPRAALYQSGQASSAEKPFSTIVRPQSPTNASTNGNDLDWAVQLEH